MSRALFFLAGANAQALLVVLGMKILNVGDPIKAALLTIAIALTLGVGFVSYERERRGQK